MGTPSLGCAAVALTALTACGRVGFDALAADGSGDAMSDPHLPITYVQGLAGFLRNAPSATFQVTPQNAGDLVLMQFTWCKSTLLTPTVTAPGWTFQEIGSVFDVATTSGVAAFAALAPDSTQVDVTATGGCSQTYLLADELAHTAPDLATAIDAEMTVYGTSSPCSAAITTNRNDDALWGACMVFGLGGTMGTPPSYTVGSTDGAGESTAYQPTSDPAGTVEDFSWPLQPSLPFGVSFVALAN